MLAERVASRMGLFVSAEEGQFEPALAAARAQRFQLVSFASSIIMRPQDAL
jgi:hypothetical protein